MKKILFAVVIVLLSATIVNGQTVGGWSSGSGSGSVATDPIFDNAGDLVQGDADNTAERLVKGAEGTLLRAGATKVGWSTATFANTYAKGTFLYNASANTVASLAHPGAANYLIYTNAADTMAYLASSANMISLLGSADYATARTNLGLAIGTNVQAYDAELAALAGLTSAANAIPYFTGSGTAGVISSSANIITFLGSATNAEALTNLGGWGVSGAITDEQLICSETTGGTNLLKSCGAKTTINAGNSTLLCKDSSGEVEACGGITVSGTTSPIININPQEVDAHTTSTNLTAAQVSNTVIHNYDQAASDVFTILPAAASGYSFLVTITTAQANHFCVEADSGDKIYLIAAAGTIASGDDGAGVCMMAAQVGQQFACWSFKTGASSYDWACKAVAIGTSTFEALASSE